MASYFPLRALLEHSRRVERRCLDDWLPLEIERARLVCALQIAEQASLERFGPAAATDWWHARLLAVVASQRERLGDLQTRWEVADAALLSARSQRRAYEKLEERFLRRRRERLERNERRELDESNAMSHARLQRAP